MTSVNFRGDYRWIKENTTIIESSSGNTAVSEAYFARLLGLPFVAVVPHHTAKKKIEQIQLYGGEIYFVERADQIHEESRRLAKALKGHYMDQFTYAERATDWRGNNKPESCLRNGTNCLFQDRTFRPKNLI